MIYEVDIRFRGESVGMALFSTEEEAHNYAVSVFGLSQREGVGVYITQIDANEKSIESEVIYGEMRPEAKVPQDHEGGGRVISLFPGCGAEKDGGSID